MTTPVLIYLYHTGKEDTHMEKRNETIVKLAQTALMAALCFVSFTFLQIKIPLPGGDATSFHLGNTFCVLGALILGGWYGGLAGAGGMTIVMTAGVLYKALRPVLLKTGMIHLTRTKTSHEMVR